METLKNPNPRPFKLPITLTLLMLSCTSTAGLPSGPYLAWINLHENTKPQITQTIRDFLKTQQNHNLCGDFLSGWIVYTHQRPPGISHELTSNTFDRHEKTAKQSLIKALKLFQDKPDVDDGLDGVMAYSEAGAPHIVSLDTHGNIKKSKPIQNTNNYSEVNAAFCSALPEVYRK